MLILHLLRTFVIIYPFIDAWMLIFSSNLMLKIGFHVFIFFGAFCLCKVQMNELKSIEKFRVPEFGLVLNILFHLKLIRWQVRKKTEFVANVWTYVLSLKWKLHKWARLFHLNFKVFSYHHSQVLEERQNFH